MEYELMTAGCSAHVCKENFAGQKRNRTARAKCQQYIFNGTRCKKQVWSYLSCTPGVWLSSSCYYAHVIEELVAI